MVHIRINLIRCARTASQVPPHGAQQNLQTLKQAHCDTPDVGAGPHVTFQPQVSSKRHFVSCFTFVSKKNSVTHLPTHANTNIKMVWPYRREHRKTGM